MATLARETRSRFWRKTASTASCSSRRQIQSTRLATCMGIADLAQDYVRGVVAWIDMLGPSAAGDIRYWSRFRKLKGSWPYLQDLPEDDWVLKPELEPGHLAPWSRFGSFFRYPDQAASHRACGRICETQPWDLMVTSVDHMAKPGDPQFGARVPEAPRGGSVPGAETCLLQDIGHSDRRRRRMDR